MIEELKQQRLQLKLSQDQVAATMGTTQSALSRAERGGNPTQDFLQRYDDALRSLSASGSGGTGDPSGNGSKGSNGNMSVETSNGNARSSTVEIATIRFIIGKIARKYGLSEVYVYGSTARGEADADSDIDLLYRSAAGSRLNMMRRESLQRELEDAFRREVSLTSLDSLQHNAQRSRASRRFYQHIQPDMIRVA
ncbi:nucleotidyltransferase domain protein [Bifidobacterium ruminantium]|uniref:Nucleotidyltransferase domain protein n=2 Tax=Bifidobacterium ruminantium TaxID=78346 RepID=A0A087CRZ6_BIFRU|nr:nucleotidyltransferase domain protein [Bifidobacterium ruminantium]